MHWNSEYESCEFAGGSEGVVQPCCSSFKGRKPSLDKENLQEEPDFMKTDPELSLYETASPNPRRVLEELDVNTQDSGYEGDKFCDFAKSLGVTPQNSWSVKRSFGSMESVDEEFMEFNVERVDLPSDFNSLISGKLVHPENSPSRPVLRRSLSENAETPRRVEARASKRAKAENPLFQRSMSVNEESIKHALTRSLTEPDLIGDFSRSYCLPLVSGRHQDLKSITAGTLASVINGEFNHELNSYKIIDCRFPYEYDGGHVKGAVNLYTKDQVLELLNEEIREGSRHVLIFHCEFSSERGPTLYRFLRNLDRIRNKDAYPALNYPEIYLLEGGYKSFYEQYKELCVPSTYMPMLHPEHQSDLRYFRAKSKSSSENRFHPNNRGSFKRLGFL